MRARIKYSIEDKDKEMIQSTKRKNNDGKYERKFEKLVDQTRNFSNQLTGIPEKDGRENGVGDRVLKKYYRKVSSRL